jgi:hypothetical protein
MPSLSDFSPLKSVNMGSTTGKQPPGDPINRQIAQPDSRSWSLVSGTFTFG